MSLKAGAGSMRCFFAVWPDAAARQRIAAAAALVEGGDGARPVPPENYHLTLAFVGEIAAAQLAVLRQVGRELRAPGFTLAFDAYEYWPKPEVVVAAAREIPTALSEIWQRLHRDLNGQGLALAPKRLRPHVTLARKVTQAPVWPAMSPFEWRALEFSLVRSDSAAAGPVYTVVDTWPLLDE
jgi:RNA 2',3'-cyclic 3'-phosphodiesterase